MEQIVSTSITAVAAVVAAIIAASGRRAAKSGLKAAHEAAHVSAEAKDASTSAQAAANQATSAARSAVDCVDVETSREILAGLEQLHRTVGILDEGLAEHRKETRRDIGGLREEIRADRKRQDRIDARLSEHLDNARSTK